MSLDDHSDLRDSLKCIAVGTAMSIAVAVTYLLGNNALEEANRRRQEYVHRTAPAECSVRDSYESVECAPDAIMFCARYRPSLECSHEDAQTERVREYADSNGIPIVIMPQE